MLGTHGLFRGRQITLAGFQRNVSFSNH